MSGRRLYIGRTPPDCTRKDLEAHFANAGTILEVRLMAGFAFLEFEKLEDAEQAVIDLNGKDFMGERLIVEFAKPPRNIEPRFDDRRGPPGGYGPPGGGYGDRGGYGGDRGGYGPPRGYEERPRIARPSGGGHRLVVHGVPEGCSWQDLKDFARGAGTVTFADVDRDGKGYIEYPSRSDADEAIRSLSNTALKGSNVTVEDAAPGAGPQRGGGRDDYGRPPPRDSYGGGYGRDDGYGRPPPRDDYRPRYDDRRRDDYPRRDDRDRYDDRRGDDRRGDDRRGDDRRRSRSPVPRRERSPLPGGDRERERSPVRERERSPAKW